MIKKIEKNIRKNIGKKSLLMASILALLFAAGCGKTQEAQNTDNTENTITEAVTEATESEAAKDEDETATENEAMGTTTDADKPDTGEIGVIENTEFGQIYIDLTNEEFAALGFEYGDSVDISFDNGKSVENVPYHSGYYCQIGDLILCAYPGYPHVTLARNFGDSTWEEFEVDENSKVRVTLNTRGAYKENQELYSIKYSDDRNDYDSDEIFANFRAMKGGNIKENMFYRSASPCDSEHGRALYSNALIKDAGVKYVLNLADSKEEEMEYRNSGDYDTEYYENLADSGNVNFMNMNANFKGDGYSKIIAEAFYAMTEHEGPYLIHCMEGKDRTGFVCALILALAGADRDEIVDDYMITFNNYYGITEESDPAKYNAIISTYLDSFLAHICGVEDGSNVTQEQLQTGAENYLKDGGLTDEQIKEVVELINK